MHNRPFNPYVEPQRPSWHDVDALPARRMALLAVVLCLPMPAIAARVAWVQTVLPERVIAIWEATEESVATAPARDGRIIARDGVVLAYDQPRFDLAVQYRWLEGPPDPTWLRRRALASLDDRDRRDRRKVAAAMQGVLEARKQLWSDLSALTGVPPAELSERAAQVQQRVERIKESVQRRREERAVQRPLKALDLSRGWRGLWETLRAELTTPPERTSDDPLIVKEELQAHVLIEGVPLEVVGTIHSHPSRFPGVDVRQAADRVYPEGRLAAHVIGLRGPPEDASPTAIAADRVGRTGIELAYNRRLQGRAGVTRTVRDRRGQVLDVRADRPAVDGPDLILTLDSRLQRAAERLLERVLDGESIGHETSPDEGAAIQPVPTGGVIIILDIWTGDVLVAADAPSVSQDILQHPTEEQWRRLLDDPRHPLFPRVMQMAIAPGSVFKVLTAVAACESGRIDPDVPFFCRGYADEPNQNRCLIYRHYGIGHREVNLTEALCESCNVYFFDAARRVGPEAIADWAWRFGLGRPTGIDVPGEAAGAVPAPGDDWTPGATLQLAIGQSATTATPLQIARLMAAIANGGYLVTPRLVREIRQFDSVLPSPRGEGPGVRGTGVPSAGDHATTGSSPSTSWRPGALATAPPTNPGAIHRINGLSETTLELVRKGLIDAIELPRGTGRSARVPGVKIAGKTGTSEVGGDRPDHAWFAGYVPADAPRYAFAIALEHGGSGGKGPASIAQELISAMVELGVIATSRPEPDTSAASR